MSRIILFSIFLALSTGLAAQDLDDLVLKDVGSESQYKFSGLKNSKAAVLIFFANRCAYNDYYLDRIKKIAAEFEPQGVKFILVNSNKSDVITDESEENMKKLLSSKNLKFPYLLDNKQILKKEFRATRSPEAFLLNFKGNATEIYYSGALDDNPQSEGDVSHPYLREAILSLLNNNSLEVTHVRPVGCLIR